MATKTTRFGRGNIDPQRWDRLKTILGEALEQNSSAGRIAVVEQRCGEDTDLLEEAESLLVEAIDSGVVDLDVLSKPDVLAKFEELDPLRPFSVLLVDESFEHQAEIYLLEDGNLIIEDSLFKDIDKELDSFLEKLMDE